MQPNTANFDPLIDVPPARYVVGIDLGTTNSAVTYIDTAELPWKIRVLLISQWVSASETESLDTLPSFYYQPIAGTTSFDFCVGAYARDETARTSGRGIASAKSWLCHSAVDRLAALLPWHGMDDVQRLSPVEVSAAFLSHIRSTWDQQFPGQPLADQDVVLTLPASFDEVARELTVAAAALAGLSRVVLIEEPQAAFYAWVYKHDSNWDSQVAVGQKILVCDIGGGTSDFTLIRVRKNSGETIAPNKSNSLSESAQRIQFHRVAVGNHLILGGDNLDLAIAKFLEQKLTDGGKLEPYQWDVLVGSSRTIKEQLLSDDGVDSITLNLPGRGSKLIGGSLQTKVQRQEIRELVLTGFLPIVDLFDQPALLQSGFQEFGLPYANDAAITRYLAHFLTTHATAGEVAEDLSTKSSPGELSNRRSLMAQARPEVILFNGGFFASNVLRETVIRQISQWFRTPEEPNWEPTVLENDRLDLAVARGAAYFGMVRRNQGVKIAATLARSYYIGIGGDPPQAICIMPGSAESGQSFALENRTFKLTISQPVEFTLYVSSIRLADQPGHILNVDPEQLTALPPIRTVLKTKSRNEKRELSVQLRIGLTELGTLDLSCHELDTDRAWKLQFDVRSTTQTDRSEHVGTGEAEEVLDESLWNECQLVIASVFGDTQDEGSNSNQPSSGQPFDPKTLITRLSAVVGINRNQWPLSLLRRIWQSLIEMESGRRRSPQHEARWLNLLGFSLRPGYGVALDDWRVTETWRNVSGKQIHAGPNIRQESLILWRRLAGGLSRGQQMALAEPWLAALRGLERQLLGKSTKGMALSLRREESVEVWRLLGSLELIHVAQKRELGELILNLKEKPKMSKARDAMVWALGRLGQRRPVYGPLNTVLPPDNIGHWIASFLGQSSSHPLEQLAIVQMARRTDDRYRDIDNASRQSVMNWLERQQASTHLIDLVGQVGKFDEEEQGRVFGEVLPPGLRLE